MVLKGALVDSELGGHATVRGGEDFHVPVATGEVNCSGNERHRHRELRAPEGDIDDRDARRGGR